MPKIESYEDQQYNRKKNIFSMLQQALEDVKYDRNGKHGWNRNVDDLGGISMRLLPTNQLELTFHRYKVTTREGILREQGEGYKLVDELSKELKKKFRENAKKTLTLKKVREDESVEKTSMLQSASSQFGSFAETSRPYARMLIRSTIVYDFDAAL